MKKIYLLLAAVLITTFTGCNIKNIGEEYYDTTPPAPPTNIRVLNGDNLVDLFWNASRESDVAGYNIYYSTSYSGRYELIGNSSVNRFADYGAVNGTTYYYAVTAYDYNDNESALSHDVIYSTPRPEGYNQSIFDYRRFPNNSGYSFTTYSVVPFNSTSADFFFEKYDGTYYLDVYDDSDIIDMGPTTDIYDIENAPNSGWSTTKDAVVRAGHTYVIWTWDNHFAKVRVNSVAADRLVFDWAFQLQEGNPQLQRIVNDHRGSLKKSASLR